MGKVLYIMCCTYMLCCIEFEKYAKYEIMPNMITGLWKMVVTAIFDPDISVVVFVRW
jgi:hypothetical protein